MNFLQAIPQRARGVLKITCQGDDVIVEQLDCGDVMAKYKEKFGEFNYFTELKPVNIHPILIQRGRCDVRWGNLLHPNESEVSHKDYTKPHKSMKL